MEQKWIQKWIFSALGLYTNEQQGTSGNLFILYHPSWDGGRQGAPFLKNSFFPSFYAGGFLEPHW